MQKRSRVYEEDTSNKILKSESDDNDLNLDFTYSEDDTNYSKTMESDDSETMESDDSETMESDDLETMESDDLETMESDDSETTVESDSKQSIELSDEYIYDSDDSVQNELIKKFMKSKINLG